MNERRIEACGAIGKAHIVSARLERAVNSLGSDLRGEPLPEDGPKEVARAAAAFNAMSRVFEKDTGSPLCVTDAYRSLATRPCSR